MLGCGRLDLGVEQTRLCDGRPCDRVDLDVTHLLGAEHDPVVQTARTAGQARSRAAGHHWDAVRVRPPQRGLHVRGGGRADKREWHGRIGVESAIVPVAGEDVGIGDEDPGRELFGEGARIHAV